jgi:hypothetical protein
MAAVICLLLLVAGCTQTATLALKFTPQDSTTYRVITEREKSVEFKGALAEDRAFEGGSTSSRVDMTFAQEIQSVDNSGNAIAKITIKELKYTSKVKNVPDADFDSSRAQDQRSPLARLIGRNYRIKFSPAGEVIGIVDVRNAQAAIRGRTQAHQTALALIKHNVIKERHTVLTLPPVDKNQVRVGDNWSSIRDFSYGMLGSETFERIYTLKELKDINGRRLAVVEMNAIPSAEMAEELYKKQAPVVLPNADNTQTYTGQVELDLATGKVEKCFEKMRTEWIIVDRSIKPGDNKEPAAVTMAEVRLYSLERID